MTNSKVIAAKTIPKVYLSTILMGIRSALALLKSINLLML